jgi:hypothetical protein
LQELKSQCYDEDSVTYELMRNIYNAHGHNTGNLKVDPAFREAFNIPSADCSGAYNFLDPTRKGPIFARSRIEIFKTFEKNGFTPTLEVLKKRRYQPESVTYEFMRNLFHAHGYDSDKQEDVTAFMNRFNVPDQHRHGPAKFLNPEMKGGLPVSSQAQIFDKLEPEGFLPNMTAMRLQRYRVGDINFPLMNRLFDAAELNRHDPDDKAKFMSDYGIPKNQGNQLFIDNPKAMERVDTIRIHARMTGSLGFNS